MSYTLHVCRKYDVEYGETEAFNYKCEEFHDLLQAVGAEFTGESTDSTFEVSRSDWTEKLIGKLRNLDDQEEDVKEDILDATSCLNLTPEEIIDIAERLLEESDPNNDYLVLTFY